jgi:hypothetical protein
MSKLRTSTKPADQLSSQEILETLLVEAGAAGTLPMSEKKLPVSYERHYTWKSELLPRNQDLVRSEHASASFTKLLIVFCRNI